MGKSSTMESTAWRLLTAPCYTRAPEWHCNNLELRRQNNKWLTGKVFFLVKSHRGEKKERKVICLSFNINIQQKKPNSEPQNSHVFKNENMIKKMLGKTAQAGRIFFFPQLFMIYHYLWCFFRSFCYYPPLLLLQAKILTYILIDVLTPSFHIHLQFSRNLKPYTECNSFLLFSNTQFSFFQFFIHQK